MKKIIAISVVWLLCLTGCGGDGSESKSSDDPAIEVVIDSIVNDPEFPGDREQAACFVNYILDNTSLTIEDFDNDEVVSQDMEKASEILEAYVTGSIACGLEIDLFSEDDSSEDVLSSGGNYGDDPYLDSLYDQCADGDNQACDDLFWQSPGGSEYEAFGNDCGGRGGLCETSSGNYGDDPYLDSLYDQCANGDDEACDDLFWTSPYAFAGSEYVDFALACGGRDCQIPISEMGSRNYWPMRYGEDVDLDNLYDQCANGDDQACNDLFLQSNETSEYSFFAALCGFRDCVIPISETFENDIPATEIPFFYGEDDFLDNLYDQCADGNDEACDDLFWQSVGGSEYGNFALTCGGRGCQIPMDGRSMNYGDNAYLDNLYDQCADGNDQACNDLYFQSFGGSEYEEFALTCGGRGCQIPG